MMECTYCGADIKAQDELVIDTQSYYCGECYLQMKGEEREEGRKIQQAPS